MGLTFNSPAAVGSPRAMLGYAILTGEYMNKIELAEYVTKEFLHNGESVSAVERGGKFT